jgi:arylsulfatase
VETNQYYPALYEGTTPVEPDTSPEDGYYFNDDLTKHATKWIRQQKSLMPDKPFFAYYAPGATHAPHHVPHEWSDKYKGRFDQGWDALREETFARQKELGVIPADADLTERSAGIPAWDDVAEDMKPILARQMEIYAGYLENTDHHVGLLMDTLADLGILDETLVFVIIGDNGASAEGSLQGTFNEMITLGGYGALETPDFMSERIDLFGGPEAYNHYAVGWAHAMDTPYQWTKQVASHFGGTRNGTIVRWPAGIDARGEVRSQFHHVIDIVPTILDVAGLPAPVFVDGVQQKPLEGVSMTYSFNDPDAAERHETQYFEMFGNRGIYHKGWTAVTKHRTPWETGPDVVTPAFDDDVWELYDTTTDWTQAHDVSSQHPDKLHELQRLWLIEAVKYDVVPLDDRFATRALPEMSGRPALVTGRKQLLFGGMGRLTESSVLSMKNTSFSMTAEIVVPETGAEGVIVAQGGVTGGMSLYLKDGRPKFCYNFFGLERYYAEGSQKVTPGTHQVRMEFTYDGGGIGKGGISRLFIDGVDIGSGRIEQTEAFLFSADETCDVGDEFGSPVTTDYNVTTFTGEVNWVELELGLDDNNHLIDPSDRIRLAMGIQ